MTDSYIVPVKEIKIYGSEDPQIELGSHLYEWEKSEEGEFVMKNSLSPVTWVESGFGHEFKIFAQFDEKTYTYWKLKYT
jgi:hypothetical protein